MRIRLLATFFITAFIASAESPGGVDLAWKVLPRRVVADNYGVRIAKLYFAVVAVVGNNSGKDLQVSSLFFQLPAASGIPAPVPSDPYRIVRGSLEHERQIGLRNTAVNLIKGAGPLLGSLTIFFSAVAYTRAVDLFSNPFEKGLEMVFPDKTVDQLASLDGQALHDSAIIGNNSQQTLLVFVSRDMVLNNANRKQLSSRFKSDFEPQVVMRELGDLVLVGKSLSYSDRVRITSSGH
jgi:hypothetical protein